MRLQQIRQQHKEHGVYDVPINDIGAFDLRYILIICLIA